MPTKNRANDSLWHQRRGHEYQYSWGQACEVIRIPGRERYGSRPRIAAAKPGRGAAVIYARVDPDATSPNNVEHMQNGEDKKPDWEQVPRRNSE